MKSDHTGKDEEIDRKGIIEIEKQLNGHVFFWSKIWGSGEDHGHRDRIIDSKVVSSEQLADLYLLYKDHKAGRKTRPVATGCTSNTRGFSNCVSDLLESVNKASLETYEAISSEDMLAKVEKYNEEAEKIMKEGKEKLYRKVMCSKKDGMRNLICCDKLWQKKSSEARRKMELDPNDEMSEERKGAQEDLREGSGRMDPNDVMSGERMGAQEDLRERMEYRANEDCKEVKHEEMLKY